MSSIRLAELFGSLSMFADIADGFPPEKVLRTTVLAVEIGRREGFDDEVLRQTFYTSLLRYAGCVGFSHEEANVYGAGNDIALRTVMAMADPTEPLQTARSIAIGVGAGAPIAERARAVATLLGDRSAVQKHARAQCDTSLWVARATGMSDGVVSALGQICERWDGLGAPAGVAGLELLVPIRLHHVGDILEIALHRHGPDGAIEVAKRRGGKQLGPSFAVRFVRDARELAPLLTGPGLWERYLAAEPAPHATASELQIDDLARAFAALADLKSVFTCGHSAGVAEHAVRAAKELGIADGEVAPLRRAAWLHDIGRAGVPNSVWDKPLPLSPGEWESVRMHAYYTDRILARASALHDVARIASTAHERCDATGYYRGLPGTLLSQQARVLAAADAFTAMQEPRPHRPALSLERARETLAREATDGRFCRTTVDALISDTTRATRTTGSTRTSRSRRTPGGLTEREVEVLRAVARGKSNREIGEVLGISGRTVQNHVAHVYDKLGVYSRAGATLYAIESGLFDVREP